VRSRPQGRQLADEVDRLELDGRRASFKVAPLPGDSFVMTEVPPDLIIGANNVAVTSDGTHDIFVGTMWSSGVWRYVEE